MGLFNKPKPAQARQQTVTGPLHAVPCPHCGHTSDWRELELAGDYGNIGLEPGTTVSCDHCNLMMRVVGVNRVTIITVRRA